MKHLKTFEQLNEKMVPFAEILKDETQQGLIVSSHTRNGQVNDKVVLYDFDDDKILGYLDMSGTKASGFFEVNNVYATKDYGPVIYDIALMYASPMGVKPDIIIKPAAAKVWKYYKENRPDVKKEPLRDKVSTVARYQEVDGGPYLNDKDVLDLINTVFSLKPSDEYKKLIDSGEKYLSKYGKDKKELMNRADKEFHAIYRSE